MPWPRAYHYSTWASKPRTVERVRQGVISSFSFLPSLSAFSLLPFHRVFRKFCPLGAHRLSRLHLLVYNGDHEKIKLILISYNNSIAGMLMISFQLPHGNTCDSLQRRVKATTALLYGMVPRTNTKKHKQGFPDFP